MTNTERGLSMTLKERIIILDFNGTVIDDLDFNIRILNEMLKRRGLSEVSREFYLDRFDFPVIRFYEEVGMLSLNEDFSDIADEYNSMYVSGFETEVRLHENVTDCIRRFRNDGKCVYLISATSQENLDRQTEALGIRGMFDGIIGSNNIRGESKTSVIRSFLEERNISSEEALMIGDTVHDFEIASETGCKCLLFSRGHNSESRLRGKNAFVFSSFSELL